MPQDETTDETLEAFEIETVVALRGPLDDLRRAAARLREHGIEAVIGSPEGPGCSSKPNFQLEIARSDAGAAAAVFEQDWRAGLDAEQIAALEAAAAIVIDPEAAETTCPACLTTFATGPMQCPECGLTIG